MPYSRCGECLIDLKPLRIKITGIRKERLLDISEEDAKREGYKSKEDCIEVFCKLNFKVKAVKGASEYKFPLEFVEVWVLEFCLESDLK